MGKREECGVLVAMRAAMAAPYRAERASGCGRAYVCVDGDRAMIRKIRAACEKLGLIYTAQGYGVGRHAIYMGYDNADGRALGKAKAFAEVLKAHGISAYDDAAGD